RPRVRTSGCSSITQRNSLLRRRSLALKLGRGDVDKAFETVDQILEDEVYLRGQEHFYMETQGLIAMPKRENGELELFVASQHAAYTQVRHT
uniref:Aldehyde oxidase 5 n=1 Tax=Hucho hucho TaxID=62062 RepID=A0A4W5P544_9TELE